MFVVRTWFGFVLCSLVSCDAFGCLVFVCCLRVGLGCTVVHCFCVFGWFCWLLFCL